MKTNNEINFNLINDLYMDWYNEQDPFMQRKKKEEIKSKVSPYEFLMYNIRYFSPFEAFRHIFSLNDLFESLEEMKKRGKDISNLTRAGLIVKSIEDIQDLNKLSKRQGLKELDYMNIVCVGNNIFEYGDFKNISKRFQSIHVNNLNIEKIEQLLKSKKDYKGIPIRILIDNIGQLPLEKLSSIEEYFDVEGVKIAEKDKIGKGHQGEQTPLNLRTYKQIRQVVDDILAKLYVSENKNKLSTDFQLAVQIIDNIASKIEYDFDAEKKPKTSEESINASSLVGLLTGKAICKGYSEILRNALSCANIDSTVIDGIILDDGKEFDHSWNLVKLGDEYFNVDITTARKKIIEAQPSGNLFMSDMCFFGDTRTVTFDKGTTLESNVIVGGHINYANSRINHQCKNDFSPGFTASLINTSRMYDEIYKKSKGSNGIIPYVGSNIEKMRSSSKNINVLENEYKVN